MPEIQFRPLIISLWGITGVGKTDLVRTLIKHLNFTDKFIEIQMDMKNEYARNIENYLDNSGIDATEPAVLLIDEIQRYRTIDEAGNMIDNKYFNDIWMLLSDGKFGNNSTRKYEMIGLLMSELYFMDSENNEETATDEPTKRKMEKEKSPSLRKYKTSYWSASHLKKALKLEMPLDKIMEMSIEERIKLIEDNLKSDNVNEGASYEKLLIFISGNLDEAFNMSDFVEDSESDADIYHELSKRINIIHIKSALFKQFKPEQIARFGNNHVIYPCLDKQSYYKIIKINCDKILENIKIKHNINITLDAKIYDTIYRNGVFPTQGVRPVISTISNLLGSNLPYFIYNAFENNVKEISLSINGDKLYATINNVLFEKEVTLDIDNIHSKKSIDEKMLIIVHEIGHALIYALLFNTAPKQININSSGFYDGFIIKHNSIDNKTYIKNNIAVCLGGLVAEEMVFGEEYKTNGSQSDLKTATNVAGKYVRSFAMSDNISTIVRKEAQIMGEFNYDIQKTNEVIENILSEEKKRARDLLNKNVIVYKDVLNYCIENNGITIKMFFEICNKHNMNLITKEINDNLIYSYDDIVKKFLKN